MIDLINVQLPSGVYTPRTLVLNEQLPNEYSVGITKHGYSEHLRLPFGSPITLRDLYVDVAREPWPLAGPAAVYWSDVGGAVGANLIPTWSLGDAFYHLRTHIATYRNGRP